MSYYPFSLPSNHGVHIEHKGHPSSCARGLILLQTLFLLFQLRPSSSLSRSSHHLATWAGGATRMPGSVIWAAHARVTERGGEVGSAAYLVRAWPSFNLFAIPTVNTS